MIPLLNDSLWQSEGKGGYLIGKEEQERIVKIGVIGGWFLNFRIDGQHIGFSDYLASEEDRLHADEQAFREQYGERGEMKLVTVKAKSELLAKNS